MDISLVLNSKKAHSCLLLRLFRPRSMVGELDSSLPRFPPSNEDADPRSDSCLTGGDLHWIWAPYSLYAEVDYM